MFFAITFWFSLVNFNWLAVIFLLVSIARTWNTGDAEHMGITHIKLVNQWPGLIGIDNDHFTGWMSAGQDPHTATHRVCLM